MFHYEMCLMHYTVLVIQSVNTCEGHIVCPCDDGTGARPDGNDGGESQRGQVFAHPNIYCHSL